jgi:hypothetical protein
MRVWRFALLLVLFVAALPLPSLSAQTNPLPPSATPLLADGAKVVGVSAPVKLTFTAISGSPSAVRWRWGAPPTDAETDSLGWVSFLPKLSIPISFHLRALNCAPATLYTQVRNSSGLSEVIAKSASVILDADVQAQVRATNPHVADKASVFTPIDPADFNSDGGASDGDPGYTRDPVYYLAINGAEECSSLKSFQVGRSANDLDQAIAIPNNAFFNTFALPIEPGNGVTSFFVRVSDTLGNIRDFPQQLYRDTIPPILDLNVLPTLTASNPQPGGLVDLRFAGITVSDNLYPGGFWGLWLAASREPISDPTTNADIVWTAVEVPATQRGDAFTIADWDFAARFAQPTIGNYHIYARFLDGAGNPSGNWLETDFNVASIARPTIYTVSGDVKLKNGTPLPGVTVALNRPGLLATTDLAGRYSISGVPRGEYIISAYRAGYSFDTSLAIDLTSDRTITFTADRDTASGPVAVPTRPSQTRTVGGLTIYADTFSDSGSDWTASSPLWLGDYSILDDGSLRYSGGALSGTGTLSMITSADRKQRSILFADDFTVTQGVLTPALSTGFTLKLGDLGGFEINQQLLDTEINLLQGIFSTTVNLHIAFPGNDLLKQFSVTLDFRGKIDGKIKTAFSLNLGYANLEVVDATLATNGIRLGKTVLKMPETLGGASAELSLIDARITSEGRFTLAEGTAQVDFPELKIGGAEGFGLSDARAILTIKGADTLAPEFIFNGKATFKLPGLSPPTKIRDPQSKGGCKLATEFEFSTRPPPFRKARIELKKGCIQIPIGQTGFVLTEASGEVALQVDGLIQVRLGVGIESLTSFLDEAAVSSNPTAFWDNSWKVGLEGQAKIFGFEIADAMVSLSAARGYEGIITLDLLGSVITGKGHIHIWNDRSGFHITGKQAVQIQVTKGRIFDGCDQFDIPGCLSFPYEDITYGSETNFGEFQVGSERVYGIKGVITTTIPLLGTYYPAYFVPAGILIDASKIRFDLGGLKEYQLVTPTLALQANTALREVSVAANTAALVVGVAYTGTTSATVVLRDPNGAEYRVGDAAVSVVVNPGQTLCGIANPMPGVWQISVANLPAGRSQIVALGAARPAAIDQLRINPNNDDSFTIAMTATSSTPTSTISLFYDEEPNAFAGRPITEGLALNTGSFRWQPIGVASGEYYIYAMVDDPLGAPAYRAITTPITISDTTAPAPPTALTVLPAPASAELSWQAPTDADVAGYRVYYRDPRYGKTFVTIVPDAAQLDLLQGDLRLNGVWEFSISAYDTSGNESSRSFAVSTPIRLYQINVPILRR